MKHVLAGILGLALTGCSPMVPVMTWEPEVESPPQAATAIDGHERARSATSLGKGPAPSSSPARRRFRSLRAARLMLRSMTNWWRDSKSTR